MRGMLSAIVTLCFCVWASAAAADASPQEGLLEASGIDSVTVTESGAGGLGYSAIANFARLYADGMYDLATAGLGLGVSYKRAEDVRYPLEVGFYIAPQLSGEGDDVDAKVSLILHATFFKKIGIGAGFDAWFGGEGFAPDGKDAANRFFVTLGYGLTNETAK